MLFLLFDAYFFHLKVYICVFKKFFVKQPNLGGSKHFTWYAVNSRVKISHNLMGPRAELQTYLKFWMLELSRVSVVLYKHGPIVKLEYELRF